MAKLALVNNFDDWKGGPSKRIERFRKWFSELEVVPRNALSAERFCSQAYEKFDGFLLSGSPHNVTDIDLPQESWMKDQVGFVRDCPKPILGTCFGHQLLCHAFGAEVDFIRPEVERKHNATALLMLQKSSLLLSDLSAGEQFFVEESHGQEVLAASLPTELENVAVPEPKWMEANAGLKESKIQLVQHKSRPLFGTQFHPETFEGVDKGVEKTGAELLRNFEAFCEKNKR